MIRHRGNRLLPHLAAALLAAAPAAARRDEGAPPSHLVVSVWKPEGQVWKLSLPRAGGTDAARLCFVSGDGRRLDAEVDAGPRRRVVRLSSGNGAQLAVIQLWEFASAPPGILTVFASGGERLLVYDPGPDSRDPRHNRAAPAAAVSAWVEQRAPGMARIVADARELTESLAGRTFPGSAIPRGYAFSTAPLLGLEILTGPPTGVLLGESLSIEVLSADVSGELLSRRSAWRDPVREPVPPRSVRAEVVGGKGERLGLVSGTREDDGVTTVAVVAWDAASKSETLRVTSDFAGVVRATLERSDAKGSSQLIALETVGGSGELWIQPWIVESAKGRRRPIAIPAGPEADAARGRQVFFDEAGAALRSAGLSDVDGERVLWRWYRILDSETGRAFLPELAGLADLLATMHAPPFGRGRESAWAGAVTVE